jgi:hypothetical protein
MLKVISAVLVFVLTVASGLAYPAFLRDGGRLLLLTYAAVAGALLVAAVQNISYSAYYGYLRSNEETDNMYILIQRTMLEFSVFLFLKCCGGYYFKSSLAKVCTQDFQSICSDTTADIMLQERPEDRVVPSLFDGSHDTISALYLGVSLSYAPFLVGISIGASAFHHTATLWMYCCSRIIGCVSLCRCLDQRGVSAMLSWASLVWFAGAFPGGIIVGDMISSEQPTGFHSLVCAAVAASLIVDYVNEWLPKQLSSAETAFPINGDWNIFATNGLAIIAMLVFSSNIPEAY